MPRCAKTEKVDGRGYRRGKSKERTLGKLAALGSKGRNKHGSSSGRRGWGGGGGGTKGFEIRLKQHVGEKERQSKRNPNTFRVG